MSFPFVQAPTLTEFVQKVVDLSYGIEKKQAPGSIIGPDGNSEIFYLCREENGEILHVVLPEMDDDERLNPTIVRNLCNRLKISTAPFGFTFTADGFKEPTHD